MNDIAIDIGSEFVDVAYQAGKRCRVAKLQIAGKSDSGAILDAVDRIAADWDIALDDASLRVRIGSTGAVNALLARRGARVGLLTSEGFADTLYLGRQNRADLYDPVARSPVPAFLVERENIAEVEGRIDAAGAEVTALHETAVRRAAERFRVAGVEAVAVCLLFAHVNPNHELRCVQVLRALLPGVEICLSHEIDPNAREYERTVATCLEAWLRPSRLDMLRDVEAGLAARRFCGRLLFADARGNLIDAETVRRRVIALVASGPAVSALAAAHTAAALGFRQALSMDIGSTSTDIALVEEGEPMSTSGTVFAGVPLRLPMADVASIALGGGCRVNLDSADGSFSASRHLRQPTLNDALAQLGLLPHALAGEGLMQFARERRTDPDTAARHIVDAAEIHVASALLRHAVKRNLDPSTVPLVALGGLGGLLAAGVADRLGISRIALPAAPATGGALGLLTASPVSEAEAAVNAAADDSDGDRLKVIANQLLDQVRSEAAGRGEAADLSVTFSARMAASPHMHALAVPLGTELPSAKTFATRFQAYHLKQYNTQPPGPSFVFSVSVKLSPPADATRPASMENAAASQLEAGTAGLITTDAGSLRVPDGWDVARTAEGIWTMTRRERKASAAAQAVDLRTLQMRLDGIAQGMQETLFKVAVSPVVREGNDAASALLTPGGEIMALSDAIPLLLGALQGSVGALLAKYPTEIMRPGDLYFMNDPYAGGTHLPDITVMMPVFAGQTLVGLAASILHHQDVGGMRAGSVPPDAVEIFQEGLRIPPLKLGESGEIFPCMRSLIEANTRTPEIVLGDLGAQIGAANRAAVALARLAEEIGVEEFGTAVGACLDRAEEQVRALVASIPGGPHLGTDGLDPTPGLPPVEVRVALSCDGTVIRADFTGTSPQVAAPINCVRSGPLAAVFYSLLSIGGPEAFRNGGILRAVELVLPQASVINAAPPAAVNARMGVVRATTSAVLQALSSVLPDVMPAANSGMSYVLAFSGRNEDGRPFVSTEIIAGGAGGGPKADGAAGLSTDVGNAMNMSAEALEAIAPVRLVRAAIRAGSGGSGRFKGGDGIVRVYEALVDGVAVSLRGERFQRVPMGLLGGGSPAPARATIERVVGTVEVLPSRSTPRLDKGDRLRVESCGGAGYGPARERPDSQNMDADGGDLG